MEHQIRMGDESIRGKKKKHRRMKYLGCIYFDPRWVLKDLFDGIHLRQITSKGGCGMSIDIVDLQIDVNNPFN
jgi:hypothetical protein